MTMVYTFNGKGCPKGKAMKLKHLTRQGNSLAVIIDRPILDMLDINEQTPLKLTTDKGRIILEPVSEQEIEQRFSAASAKVQKRFGRMFKRLAKK
jgi:antitoxin MazE